MIASGRFEFKYAVSEELAARALEWARPFLQPDRGIHGRQQVTSLYLDSPALSFFRWHCEGASDRFKLRIRCYGDWPGDHVFAEIKRKKSDVVHKQRARVPAGALRGVLGGARCESFGEGGPEALRDFLRKRESFRAAPKIFLRYERDSLREKQASGEVAVTVDRNIRCQAADGFHPLDRDWQAVTLPAPSGFASAILELKYSVKPPSWMARLIEYLEPRRVSFSKYRAAVEQHLLSEPAGLIGS
ncbi:MAG: polyphosphate polymerase domain-containing protein [Acidobacteria bacterium]|nr:polyphosphate polymerase domain-containing protein [Acidobacteriota bacterium]